MFSYEEWCGGGALCGSAVVDCAANGMADGGAIGLIAGGLLTQYASWRWCLFVNIPMALIAVALAIPNVRESRIHGTTRYDVPGALLSTMGVISLVYGITEAANPSLGWSSPRAIGFIAAGAVLLVAFVAFESRTSNPLLPMSILLDRVRGGSYLAQFLLASGLFGMFLFMTFYFQGVHGGLLYLSRITFDSSYVSSVLPALILMSLGLGAVFVVVSSTALFNVPFHESGVASAVLNTTQQIGGSLGTAIFNTLAISATAAYAIAHPWSGPTLPPGVSPPDALTHGFSVAFELGSGCMLVAAIVVFTLVNVDRHHLGQHDDVGEPDEDEVLSS